MVSLVWPFAAERCSSSLYPEKEMLSEARAHLANTQGKKAKRKAREHQLEEARQLAVLQKKRELKATGIMYVFPILIVSEVYLPSAACNTRPRKREWMYAQLVLLFSGLIDFSPSLEQYNADIPFEKKAAPGFYDTSDEQARITTAPVGQSLHCLENKHKPDDEEAKRRKHQQKGKDKAPHQTKFIPAHEAQIQKLKEAESIGHRRKLELPAAQVSEAELEDIVKIGHAGIRDRLQKCNTSTLGLFHSEPPRHPLPGRHPFKRRSDPPRIWSSWCHPSPHTDEGQPQYQP